MVVVPSDRTRAWVIRLVEVLRLQFGLPTDIVSVPSLHSYDQIPSESFEQRVFGRGQEGHSAWQATRPTATADSIRWSDSLVVNATGYDPSILPPELRLGTIISPTFHGLYRMEALVGPVLSGEPPHIGVIVSRAGESWLVQGARLAVPERAIMQRALDSTFGRTITLLRGAADHLITGKPLPEPVPLPPLAEAPSGLGFWASRLLRAGLPKLGRQLSKPFRRQDWCIGYRSAQPEDSPANLQLDPASFQLLDSGRSSFYADPFVFRHDGVTALFFEDFDYGTQRGCISYVVLGEDGARGEPVQTLSRPYHLSYPYLFDHHGAAMMIPESSANGTIELYEAEAFPDRWRLRSVLVGNIEAADTTLHFDEATGIWWMFAAVTEFGSSSHDTLSIFYADRLDGPWRPHAANPVKFDPSCSRPAGPLVRWNGRLFRPAQDCTRGYGDGLVWCEIQDLTPEVFREAVVARQRPYRGFAGLHTYGRAAGFEVVDFKRNRWRFVQ
ncbi:hypothetical protein DJ021_13405 [Phenylobacterium hankyongense]|uniref:Glucosamine inositolphosphorylceramide transferase 1 N-terminal domain-containing protein n=1 Tax=Phenylobacterium hankyongense TaxID=1813876 RepID=A0A328B0N8_9CAUL|nr:hypothetical protein DJ021_13405 [Phenylobacterium hankyongense]